MITSTVKYLGELQTSGTHLKSRQNFVTDAPVDNNGKGSAFSPTDLLATSYASCMITIMGIYCQRHEINFQFTEAEVTKIMSAAPRKVEKLIIRMNLQSNGWDKETAEKVIRAGKACPVARTLENNVEVEFDFIF